MRGWKLHAHQQLSILAHQRYDTVIEVGGLGSGKTVGLALWLLDRMRWDTGQEHALFAHTNGQLQQVLQRLSPVLGEVGIKWVFNCRPPTEWIEQWKARGIALPPHRDRFTNAITFEAGLRLQLGTLFNRAYEQWKSAEWGSVAIEEFTAGPEQQAVEWVMDRARCGMGKEFCREHHRHTKMLKGNPAEDDGHWYFDWLWTLEKHAASIAGEEPSEHYAHLYRGVGPVILIPSRSSDNEDNLADGYIENQRSRLDDETAKRRLDGIISRTASGRAYNAFSRANEIEVAYDPSRTLYVALDFNINPAVAVFSHPLNPGEYPGEHNRPGVKHVGVFGEVHHVGGWDAHQLASAIVSGETGTNGSVPSNWKGLREHKGPVVAFGDATARAKLMSGPNSWQIVTEVMRSSVSKFSVAIGKTNPLVQMRVRALNARLCSATGVRSLWIDPRVEELIADFNTNVWDKKGTDIQKYGERGGSRMWRRTHEADALGYEVSELFPMGRDSEPVTSKFVANPTLKIPEMR
ncbi:MAG TPA: hypothetical protein VMO47_09125 [Rhodothermales bacterium]|nr:hypothetical protein [Rhodothermales bacterium]